MSSETETLIRDWFARHLPEDLYAGEPAVTVDREEIVVIGDVPAPTAETGAAPDDTRIAAFREATRETRMQLAERAQEAFGRTVSWGARAGETERLFTHLASPVMTRLRQPERALVDLLVEAGVVRSRSEAVAWCVSLVGDNESAWLGDLQQALAAVREARSRGPVGRTGS